MTQLTDEERAALALRIDKLSGEGFSYSEIARKLSTAKRPLTRAAAIGIHQRLKEKRAEDARDLAILDALAANPKEPLLSLAKRFGVTAGHVRTLINEANQ